MMEKYEIQKLRELPIEKVAKEMGMKVEHHKALCPFHDDHHASLTFSKTKNSCRCYVCMRNSIGTIDLVMRYQGKDFPAACRWLAEKHQIQLEEDSSSEKNSSFGGSSSDGSSSGDNSGKSSFDASRYARFFEHPWLNQAARRFLFEERKIDWRVVNWCRLTSWTDKKGINWLQIPYFDTDGRLIGIQNRNLDYTKKKSSSGGCSSEGNVSSTGNLSSSGGGSSEGNVSSAGNLSSSGGGSSEGNVSSEEKSSGEEKEQDAPRFRFPYGARCSIYNLPVVKRLKPGERLFITEGCRGKGEVHTEQRVARYAISCGSQGSSPLTVEDISYHLAHLLMPTTHSVGHLHLRQIDVLGSSAQLFASHSVLDEGRIGDIRRWKPETHVRALRFFLVGALGFHLSLPVNQFLELSLIMLSKRSHDGLYKMTQLCLSDTRRTNQMTHLPAHFVIFVVGIHESYVCEMSCQRRNCHRNEHFLHVF
jgi:hypothetical protein